MNNENPNSQEPPPPGSTPTQVEPASRSRSRGWGATKLILVFAVGLAVGFSLGEGSAGARVVYSGAMSEPEGRTAYGPDDAPVTIVEYTDYECSFCQRYNQLILPRILEAYEGRIRYIVRHFPLVQIHPASGRAAEAAVCAERQDGFWEFHDLLFAQDQGLSQESILAYAESAGLEEEAFKECVDSGEPASVVRDDMERGATYGVRGTPAFFINGRVVYGAQPLDAFKRNIDAALEEAGGG